MLPFGLGGGLFSFGPLGLFGIFFVINLIIQLVTGGLNDVFPMGTM